MIKNSTAFVGLDLGDKRSNVFMLDQGGELIEEARIPTAEPAFRRKFASLPPCRVAMEAGTHSRWASRLLEQLGHEVLVANPRRLLLPDPADTIQIGIRPVSQDLGQARSQVEGVVGRGACDGLANPVAQAGVREAVGRACLDDGSKPVGLVVGVERGPVREQVAFVVPGQGCGTDGYQLATVVKVTVGLASLGDFGLAGSSSILSAVETGATIVVGFLHAMQRVVEMVDDPPLLLWRGRATDQWHQGSAPDCTIA